MAETLTIRTASSTEVVKIAVQGPQGPAGAAGAAGPANSLSIGTVTSGATAAATITGAAPAQTLSLVLPKGDKGDKGDPGTGGASTWDEVANKPATFPPSSHAASHAAGVKAFYSGIGTNESLSESVFIRANNAGTAGNSITLTFDGVDDINTVLAAWNSANPSNQATLVSGDGYQVPDNGEEITLSGGAAGGTDPVFDQDLNVANNVQFNQVATNQVVYNGDPSDKFILASGKQGWFVAQTRNTDDGFIGIRHVDNNDDQVGLSILGIRSGIGFVQGLGTTFRVEGDGGNLSTPLVKNIVLQDQANNKTATFNAQGTITANRSYTLPNASGTLALTSDIPPAGGVSDGDKGDITVSASGATWTIDNAAVTNAKLAQVATSTIKGRATASTGNVEDLTASQVRTILNVADGATANSADGTLLNRANHTGTQTASTISDFNSAAAAAAPVASVAGRTGIVTLAKADVGLGNVDNTSDANKPISTATQTALDGKQASGSYAAATHTHTPSEVGLGNVSNTAQVTSVSGTAPIVSSGGTTPAISISAATTSAAGSMSAADKTKLDGIAAGAEVNVNADWNASSGDAQILNKPTLAAIATSGSASDLTTGTVATARLGTGTADSTTFLRGDGAWAAPSGGGSGGTKTYAVFTAEHNQPPAAAGTFATLDTRNSIAVLDFDAATDENAVFVGIMPEAASLGSGLIVRLHWMATSATSGNVRWGVQFERSNTDLDSDSFDTAVEATAAANGTSGIITTTAITVTTIDGITAGDVFRLKVFRNADDATNDTMTGDAELVAVEVRSAA